MNKRKPKRFMIGIIAIIIILGSFGILKLVQVKIDSDLSHAAEQGVADALYDIQQYEESLKNNSN